MSSVFHMAAASGSLCNGKGKRWLVDSWSLVTCKRCKAKRPVAVPPFADPMLAEWEGQVSPVVGSWLRGLRRDLDAVSMFEWVVQYRVELTEIGPGLSEEEEALAEGLFDEIAVLKQLLQKGLANGSG